MLIAVYFISVLSGYGNLDNQCKDPMKNNKDCRVGQLTRIHLDYTDQDIPTNSASASANISISLAGVLVKKT